MHANKIAVVMNARFAIRSTFQRILTIVPVYRGRREGARRRGAVYYFDAGWHYTHEIVETFMED